MTFFLVLALSWAAFVGGYVRWGRVRSASIIVTTSASVQSKQSGVSASVVGVDLEGSGNIELGVQSSLAKDALKDTKVTRRKRPSFEKVLKCLILYNELKTGNRAKAISYIHDTSDEMVVDKLVKASLRKFKGEAEVEEDAAAVSISLFLLMTPSKNFVVPDDDDRWPKDCAGIHLGQVVVDIRRKRSFKRETQKEILDTLHFPWKPTSARFAHVLEGLAIYKAQYGDKPLKSNFMVPVVSGTKGMLTNEDDEEIDESATFDPLAEQQDMWKARQRSTGHAIKGFQANKDFIFARAKAVEDSPWPVHLMGFHLGKALRLLEEDINRKYLECTSPGGGSGHSGSSNSKGGAGGGKQAEISMSSVSFAAVEGDSTESIVEEIQEQVRLLGLYGVTMNLNTAATSKAGGAISSSASLTGMNVVEGSTDKESSGGLPATVKRGAAASKGKDDTEAVLNLDSSAEASDTGSTSVSVLPLLGSKSSSAVSVPGVPPTPASIGATVKRKQGRPRRGRSEDDPTGGEPVTLAGAVKLAREKDLEMRSRSTSSSSIETARKLSPPPPSSTDKSTAEQQQIVELSSSSGHGDGDGAAAISSGSAGDAYPQEQLARGMAAVRTLDALRGLDSVEPTSSSQLTDTLSLTDPAADTHTDSSGSLKAELVQELELELEDEDEAEAGTKKTRRRRRLRVGTAQRFSFLVEGLQVYHSIHGDHHVPVQFAVPVAGISTTSGVVGQGEGDGQRHSEWPEHLHGFSLGKELSRTLTSLKELKEIEEQEARGDKEVFEEEVQARKEGLVEKRDALVSLGVPLLKRRDQNFELILSALMTHDELFGDLLVPRYFVVPSEEPWAKETWGMPLGHKVRNIRYRGAYSGARNRKRLREIGFSFEYVKDVTASQSDEKKRDLGQHWYEGAYELWEDPSHEGEGS